MMEIIGEVIVTGVIDTENENTKEEIKSNQKERASKKEGQKCPPGNKEERIEGYNDTKSYTRIMQYSKVIWIPFLPKIGIANQTESNEKYRYQCTQDI